ncbi:MAG: hypothetical protein P8090_07040 [Gammaproteobacteria bacterium]
MAPASAPESLHVRGRAYAILAGGENIGIHRNAIAVFAAVLLVSGGFNACRQFRYRALPRQFADAKWQARDMKANWVYVKGLLKTCRPARDRADK